MKNLKNLLAAGTLLAVMVLGTTVTNAGILMSDRSGNGGGTCGDNGDASLDMGIIVAGITGIIVAGRTGIIVAGRDGIIVAGKDGIIVAGKGDTPVNCGILMSD